MKFRHVLHVMLLSITMLSCKSEDLSNTPLPECLAELIDTVPSQVFVQRHNAELHFWMRGGSFVDRDEPIVNAACDTVCYFGGWIHPLCLAEYSDDWTLIWPK